MRLYNTASKEIEEVASSDSNDVKTYCCGPTVYDFAHLGNLRTFILYDVLRRVLIYNGFRVKQVMNITDVDDKTIKNAKARGMGLKEYTDIYTRAFFEDMRKLNISQFERYPRATENIENIKAMIDGLKRKGYAYAAEDGVYYSILKFDGYGKLSGATFENRQSRIGNDEYNKDNAADFALWKGWTEEDGDVYWDKDMPKGRPGWHIECSAMALESLGETVDIHCGAVDLIFPHNENEIAQSEAFTGKKFVRHWLHGEHLLVDGKKMSKSLHNFYTLRDLEKLGFDPLSFRLFMLDSHYRTKVNFTLETLKKYEKTLDDIDITIKSFHSTPKITGLEREMDSAEELEEFKNAINDDLDTHDALIIFFKLIERVNSHIKNGKVDELFYNEAMDAINKMNSVFGIVEDYQIPDVVIKLAEKRKAARARNDWGEADKIRSDIKETGFKIVDLKDLNYAIVKNRGYGN